LRELAVFIREHANYEAFIALQHIALWRRRDVRITVLACPVFEWCTYQFATVDVTRDLDAQRCDPSV